MRVKAPSTAARLEVAERHAGDATTEFGAPSMPPEADARTLDAAELRRITAIIRACWDAFDAAGAAAANAVLRKGPRGGGRDLNKMRAHVYEAEGAYLRMLGSAWRSREARMEEVRDVFVEALASRARGELPAEPRRSGARLWSPRFAVRRSAWHALDHAWEIEDRAEPARR